MKFVLKSKSNKDQSTEIVDHSSFKQLIYPHVKCREPKQVSERSKFKQDGPYGSYYTMDHTEGSTITSLLRRN